MKKKSIFVTGADGFIGSHLIERLVASGHSVRALCQYNSFGNRGWLDTLNQDVLDSVDVCLGDIRDGDHVKRLMKNADIVIINGNKDEAFEKKILKFNEKLEIFYSTYKPINIDQFKSKKLLALAGIGNPENFFDLLKKNKLNIEQELIYPDHYIFKIDEIQNIVNEAERKNYQIIMTEKDYFKIKHFNISKIKYLKVCLVINNQKILLDKIKNIYDKNN